MNDNEKVLNQGAPDNDEKALQPAEGPKNKIALLEKDNTFLPDLSDEILSRVKPEALKKAEASNLNIATQYYDFELNKPIRAIFLGLAVHKAVSQQTQEEVVLESVVFIDETRTMYVNSAVKLVSALAQLETGTPVQITWTGTKKTSNGGQMRLFDVRVLRMEEK